MTYPILNRRKQGCYGRDLMKKVAVCIHANEKFSHQVIQNLIGLDYIHVDIIDGEFAKPINLKLNVISEINHNLRIPIIAHLMVVYPFDYIDKIIKNVDIFLFHYESQGDKYKIIKTIHEFKKKVGIGLNPETSVEKVLEFLSLIDFVLILGVNPGLSGQQFIPSTIDKLKKLITFKEKYHFQIIVDGGITVDIAKSLDKVDIISSSSAILNATNPNIVIEQLKH